VIDVRFTPDATKLLRSSEMTRCARTGLSEVKHRMLGGTSSQHSAVCCLFCATRLLLGAFHVNAPAAGVQKAQRTKLHAQRGRPEIYCGSSGGRRDRYGVVAASSVISAIGTHSALMPAALMIGHHFSISAL
jgi:hypothetical protein